MPFIIVFSISTISFCIGYIFMKKMLVSAIDNIKEFIIVGSILSLIAGFFLTFFMWFIKTLSFHIISILFGGKGDFRKLLELIGYAQFPLIFSLAFVFIIVYLYIPIIDISSPNDPQIVKHTLNNVQEFKLAKLFGRLMLFWSLYLSVIAVREVHRISTRKAFASVLIPVVLYAAISEGIKRWVGI